MTALATTPALLLARAEICRRLARRRALLLAAPVVLLVYLTTIFFSFDLPGIAARMRPENAAVLLGDFWSFKTHVTLDRRKPGLDVAIEGEAKGRYAPGQFPGWVRDGAEPRIALPDGSRVTYVAQGAVIERAGFGLIRVSRDGRQIAVTLPEGAASSDWLSASATRVDIRGPWWRFSMTPARTETLRYEPGWELFFFDLQSPFHGKSAAELAALALWQPRLEPERSNLAAMAADIWQNRMWRHGDVAWALGETVLMAFLGTFGAALIAFPLAFLAASNFSPGRLIRLGLRRIFDLFRGIDGLIWTVILSRAFGPGPLTGALAILLTDTGTFGKTFSEALENIDEKQREGIASTGAPAVAQARFGVVPQVAPVILSQVLYYLESNTRSATVIGALVGGGIGLLLTQAIQTQKDWEEVSYYIVLITLMVMAMDSLSAWLRARFIKG